jgi:hypothetical protein
MRPLHRSGPPHCDHYYKIVVGAMSCATADSATKRIQERIATDKARDERDAEQYDYVMVNGRMVIRPK